MEQIPTEALLKTRGPYTDENDQVQYRIQREAANHVLGYYANMLNDHAKGEPIGQRVQELADAYHQAFQQLPPSTKEDELENAMWQALTLSTEENPVLSQEEVIQGIHKHFDLELARQIQNAIKQARKETPSNLPKERAIQHINHYLQATEAKTRWLNKPTKVYNELVELNKALNLTSSEKTRTQPTLDTITNLAIERNVEYATTTAAIAREVPEIFPLITRHCTQLPQGQEGQQYMIKGLRILQQIWDEKPQNTTPGNDPYREEILEELTERIYARRDGTQIMQNLPDTIMDKFLAGKR